MNFPGYLSSLYHFLASEERVPNNYNMSQLLAKYTIALVTQAICRAAVSTSKDKRHHDVLPCGPEGLKNLQSSNPSKSDQSLTQKISPDSP